MLSESGLSVVGAAERRAFWAARPLVGAGVQREVWRSLESRALVAEMQLWV